MENLHNHEGFPTEDNQGNNPYQAAGNKETVSEQRENKDRTTKDLTDERERANSGDWDDFRDSSRTDIDTNNGEIDLQDRDDAGNDNPGGAGSTGSKSTNSGLDLDSAL